MQTGAGVYRNTSRLQEGRVCNSYRSLPGTRTHPHPDRRTVLQGPIACLLEIRFQMGLYRIVPWFFSVSLREHLAARQVLS